MRIWFFVAICCLSSVRAHAASPILIVDNQLIASPASARASAAQLVSSRDGEVFMTWTEPLSNGASIHLSRFDPTARRWSAAAQIAADDLLVVNGFSTPQIAAGPAGKLAALWYLKNPDQENAPHPTYHAVVSQSRDRGATWSKPEPLTAASAANEFASLCFLSDGRVLAAWLDGRKKMAGTHAHRTHAADAGEQSLYARILFSDTEEQLVDARVCDCCSTALTAFPDGTALLIYRGRSGDEIRDIKKTRFAGKWSEPAALSQEHWKISGCPVNGPALASAGARVVAAWYTAAEGSPRVSASVSNSAGEPFLIPAWIDDGKPVGQVGAAMLADGTAFVTWIETGAKPDEAFVMLRRITPDGALSVPVRVGNVANSRKTGVPRITVLKPRTDSPAQLMIAYTLVTGDSSQLVTRLITPAAPEPERNPCATCPPEETRGYPVHGVVRSVDKQNGTARVKHDDIPGLMPAMTMRFHLSAEDLAKLSPEQEFYGRIEERDDEWWLFAIRTPGTR
jgi:Copper binding periplasmic protein CusF